MVILEAIDRNPQSELFGQRTILNFRFSGSLEEARKVAESLSLEVISVSRL